MARRNISIPDELDDRARAAGLNVSALTRRAIVDELDRRTRMGELQKWLDELDEQHGRPSDQAMAEAEAWARGATDIAAVAPARATRSRSSSKDHEHGDRGTRRSGSVTGRAAR